MWTIFEVLMQVFIKKNGSNRFFHLERLAWTTLEQATRFTSTADALTICLRRSLLNTSLLIRRSLAAPEQDVLIAFD